MRAAYRAVVLGGMMLASAPAVAQQSVTLNRFNASGMPADDFQVDRATTPGAGTFGVMLHLDYGYEPLVFTGSEPGGMEETAVVVGDEIRGNATFAMGAGERGLVYIGLPVVLWMDGDDDPMIGSTPVGFRSDDAGLGDAYMGGRVRIFGDEDSVVGLAGQITVTLPTSGRDQQFRGERYPTALPEVLFAIRPGAGSRITANLGARIREKSEDEDTNLGFGSEFTYALGVAVPVWRGDEPSSHLDLHAQAFGTTNFESVEDTPTEVLGGLKLFHESGFIMGAAAGPGVTRGFGTPVVRGVFMLGYQTPVDDDRDNDGLPNDEDQCPDDAEDKDGFEDEDGCPDPDNDQDGIPDTQDECAEQPETQNGLDDEDGCPDAYGDSDGDGLLDNADDCPEEPEDLDGFEDDDGCPDTDNDQDGIPDAEDECPIEKGKASNQGCPDPDRDGDGVPDRIDNCPDEPGPPENQGCQKEQKVRIESSALVITEQVFFANAKARIQPRSFNLLNDVASVMKAHPEIKHIVVEGHTDSRGSRRFNMRLSQARAESVVEYLVQQGVDASRLEAKGYGPDRPQVENAKTKEDYAKNRRVEFRIPKSETAGAETGEPAGGDNE